MGTEVARAARAEVLWASEGRSAATRSRADTAGFRDVGTLENLAGESDIVLSLCPPSIAESVAGMVAEAGFGGLYLEGNAIAPRRTQRIAETLGRRGVQLVDGSVIARGPLNLYLSGEPSQVDRVRTLFLEGPVVPIELPGGIGAASALKMAFGGWNKIGIALSAQAYAIARAYGVEEALAGEGVASDRIVRAGSKAWRWVAEMDEVAETCASLRLPEGLGRGAAAVYARWEEHRDREPELERLLDDLTGPKR